MQDRIRVKEDIKIIMADFGSEVMAKVQNNQLEELPQLTEQARDEILNVKIDGTTLKELLEKLDETGGKDA